MMIAGATSAARRLSGTVVVAINAGGGAFTSPEGISYLADTYVTNIDGGTVTNAGAMTGNLEAPVYQSTRYGSFTYAIPVANGTYDVVMKLAEVWFDPVVVGERVFSITIEGVSTGSIDMIARAGGQYLPCDVTVPITVTDGTVNISVAATADQASINGIVIRTR